MRTALALLALVLVSSACASSGAPTVLEGTLWRLVRIDDQPIVATDDAAMWPQLRIDSTTGEVRGATGCNGFSGAYQATGTSVAFGQLILTRRACVDARLQQQEERIVDLLQNVNGYRIDGTRLELMIDGRTRMRWEAWR